MIDTNKYLDGSKLLVMEHEEAKRIIAQQGAELRQLRADLEAAKKATQTAQDLADECKGSATVALTRNAKLIQENKALTDEAAKHKAECTDLRTRFDPEVKAAKLAEKAAELERLKAQAERLAAELKGGE